MRAMLLVSCGFVFGCSMAHGREDAEPMFPPADASPVADAGPTPAPDSGPIASDGSPAERDAGMPAEDAGIEDAMMPPPDAGTPDTGAPAEDAGMPDCDIMERERRLRDADGDGYGNPDDYALVNICEPWEVGYVSWTVGRDDCDDASPDVHPGAVEACNGRDDDCDGVADPGCPEPLLTVALDPATPAAHHVVMGTAFNEVLRIRLTSGPEALTFTQTALLVDIVHRGTIWNIRYMDAVAGTFPAGTLATLPADGPVLFVSPGTFTLPPHATAVIKIVVDATSYVDGGFSGETFRFGFGPAARMEGYVGLDGRMLAPEEVRVDGADVDGNIWGNPMTVVRTAVTVVKASDSPSGSATGSLEQIVARFVASNSANMGSYSATVEAFSPWVSSTIVTTAPCRIRVWKDAVGPAANLLGEYVVPEGETLDTLTPPWFLSLPSGTEVAAGGSRTFYVTADTSDARTARTLRVDLPVASVTYSDGVTTGIVPDSLPVTGNTLVY